MEGVNLMDQYVTCKDCKWIAKRRDVTKSTSSEIWKKRVKAYSDECIRKWKLATDGYVTYIKCKHPLRKATVFIEYAALCPYFEPVEYYEE